MILRLFVSFELRLVTDGQRGRKTEGQTDRQTDRAVAYYTAPGQRRAAEIVQRVKSIKITYNVVRLKIYNSFQTYRIWQSPAMIHHRNV